MSGEARISATGCVPAWPSTHSSVEASPVATRTCGMPARSAATTDANS